MSRMYLHKSPPLKKEGLGHDTSRRERLFCTCRRLKRKANYFAVSSCAPTVATAAADLEEVNFSLIRAALPLRSRM